MCGHHLAQKRLLGLIFLAPLPSAQAAVFERKLSYTIGCVVSVSHSDVSASIFAKNLGVPFTRAESWDVLPSVLEASGMKTFTVGLASCPVILAQVAAACESAAVCWSAPLWRTPPNRVLELALVDGAILERTETFGRDERVVLQTTADGRQFVSECLNSETGSNSIYNLQMTASNVLGFGGISKENA